MLAFAILSSLSANCFASNISTYGNQDKKEVAIALAQVEKTVIAFYRNKDLGTKHNIAANTDPQLYNYLEDKASVNQYVGDLYGAHLENYTINVSFEECEIKNNQLFISAAIVSSYNYTFSPEIESGYSELIFIIYDLEKDLMMDLYAPLHYYDSFVRDAESVFADPSEVSLKKYSEDCVTGQSSLSKNVSNQKLQSRQQLLKTNIQKEYVRSMAESILISASEEPTLTRATSLNKTSIVNYARANFNKAKPASGSSSIVYQDFYDGNGNYDCTNFVSHALLKGGAKMRDPGGSGIQGNTYWYYRSTGNRSTSWTSVGNLYAYMTTNKNSGYLAGTARTYVTGTSSLWVTGDVIQFATTGGTWMHSCIITAEGNSGAAGMPYQRGALCTGRTSSTQSNNNQLAGTIYPGGAKRTISPYNY